MDLILHLKLILGTQYNICNDTDGQELMNYPNYLVKKYEMCMPNAKTQRQGPNATYIPLAGVGVLRRGKRKFYVLRRGKRKF